MPLESLLELIQGLQKRIDEHGDALSQNERLTRYALIDPLLRELGWDTADPAQVVPEYRIPNNQLVDYVLLSNNSPVIVVESKKLDEPLRGGKALDQGILYCAHTGSKHFLLTDGRRWEIYESSSTAPKISFDLKEQSPAEACLKALALWRPSVEAGHVAAGQAPVLDPGSYGPEPKPDPVDHKWQSVSALDPQPGLARPVEVRFPDNSIARVTTWRSVLVEAVRWLVNGNHLNADHCPIQKPGGRNYVVSGSPVHPSGNRFRSEVQVGPLYIEGHRDLKYIVSATRFIIERVGQDPARFKVRFP